MIADYVARTAHLPFTWGKCDCCMWTGDLVREATGADPCAPFRGQYASRFECHRLLMQLGGLEAAMTRQLAGLASIRDVPEIENGVCLVRIGSSKIAGLLCDGRVLLKKDRAVIAPAQYTLVKAWTWPRH